MLSSWPNEVGALEGMLMVPNLSFSITPINQKTLVEVPLKREIAKLQQSMKAQDIRVRYFDILFNF